jgi:hypothetical protein
MSPQASRANPATFHLLAAIAYNAPSNREATVAGTPPAVGPAAAK